MGINYSAELIYGYKLEREDLKTYDEIPDELTDKCTSDYPEARACLEELWNKHKDKDFVHMDTNGMGSGGVLLVGIEIARARESAATEIDPQVGIEAADKMTDELREDIEKVCKVEDREPRLILGSTIG